MSVPLNSNEVVTWNCLPSSGAAVNESLYVLDTPWPRVGSEIVRSWGVDLTERGPSQVMRLDTTGQTLARTTELGIGAAAAHGAVARLAPASPSTSAPASGIEILDPAALTRKTLVAAELLRARTSGEFARPDDALAAAAIAIADADRIAVVQGAAGFSGGSNKTTPVGIDAICVDRGRTQRIALRSVEDGLAPCGVPPQVRATPDGFYVAYSLCAQGNDPTSGDPVTRVFTIERSGRVHFFDLPFKRFEVPFAVSRDGQRIYAADPLRQEAYAFDSSSGAVVWRTTYGVPPHLSMPKKLAPAPNQILVDLDDEQIYITTNAEAALSRGVYILDREGRMRAHLLPELGISGIALDRSGGLFVLTPERGGQLLVLMRSRLDKPQILRSDLGEGVSGVTGGV